MAWKNIFHLGGVDLYWIDGRHELRPLEELPSGTISVVDGVIMIDGVPDADGGGTPPDEFVSGVAVVPRYSAAGLTVRVSLSDADIELQTSSVVAYGGVTSSAEPEIDGGEETTPVLEGDGSPEDPLRVVSFSPAQFPLGAMPSSGLAYFYFQEFFE